MRKSKRIDVRIFNYELDALKRLCQETSFNDDQEEKLIRLTVKGLFNRLVRELNEEPPKNKQLTKKWMKFLIMYLASLCVIGTIVLLYLIFK